MSIQRYDWTNRIGEAIPSAEGQFVLYADHVAAVAEAEQRAVAAGVQAARDAVEDRRVPWPTATGDLVNEGIDDALAAIDALRGEA